MDEPANTLNYMIAGFSVIFTSLALYLISLAVRWNRLKQEELTLEEVKK